MVNFSDGYFVGPIMPDNLVATHSFFTPMVNIKILILGPTSLPLILIFYFLLVPLFQLFNILALRTVTVTPMKTLVKYSPFANYTPSCWNKMCLTLPLESFDDNNV